MLVATGSIKNGSAVGAATVGTGWTIVLGSGCRRGQWNCVISASHDGCRIGDIGRGHEVRQRVSTGRVGEVGDNRLEIVPGIVVDASRGQRRRDVDGCVAGMDALGGYGHPVIGHEQAEKVFEVWEL